MPTRRDFLRTAASAAALASLPAPIRASGVDGQERYDLVIRGGRVIDPAQSLDGVLDVGIARGRVVRVAANLPVEGVRQVIRAEGKIVTPGLLDLHVHVYDGASNVAIEPDQVGVARGVTTLVDAGTAGATTFPGFRRLIASRASSRVYSLLNVSHPGLTLSNELADLRYLDVEAAVRTIEENRDLVVGVKVRMLAGIPGDQDLEVMRRTREIADRAGVPVMVHIGGQVSPLPRVLEYLRPGDVVTHALRRDGSILDANGRVYPEVLELVRNGVYLDIGHGRGNLDFDVAEAALAQGVRPHIISSDVHRGNVAGPVFDLPTTLSKFIQMGMPLADVVACATSTAAKVFDLGVEVGSLRPGSPADVAVFDLFGGGHEFEDSGGKLRRGEFRLVPWVTFRDGRPFGSVG